MRRSLLERINLTAVQRFAYIPLPVELVKKWEKIQDEIVPKNAIKQDIDHITLVFCPKSETDIKPSDVKRAVTALKSAAKKFKPIMAKVQGWGYFDGAQKDGEEKTAVVALVDAPGIDEIHVAMKEALKGIGIEPSSNHSFTPHFTFCYLPKGKRLGRLPAIAGEFTIDHICFANKDIYKIPLGNKRKVSESLDLFEADISSGAPMADLKNVFGAFSHQPPAEPAGSSPQGTDESTPDETTEFGQVRSNISGLVLSCDVRFSGDSMSPFWNRPEPELIQWISSADIELIEERVLPGDNGVFWGRMTDGEATRSVLIRFAGIGRRSTVAVWGAEFHFDSGNKDLLSRENAAFEVAKAIGCEDLVAPTVIRDIDPVQLISDAVREKIAKSLRISPLKVDETLGIAASVQLVPVDADNFLEYWASLAPTNKERWAAASDRLRHSLYRSYFLDFILGVPDRSIASIMYNRNADRVHVPDLSISFPHSGYTAEKYMQMRLKGWGRSTSSFGRFVDHLPPTAYDFASIFEDLDDQYIEEALQTAAQITERMEDRLVQHLIVCCVERDVQLELVASMVSRLSYLSFSPGSVLKRPIEYVRNVCVPVRAGAFEGDARIEEMVAYVSEMIIAATGEQLDFALILQQPMPDIVELTV